MESTQYNENFTNYLKEENSKKEKEHESSGKISPSKLSKPTLEAVLQVLGVQPDAPSDQSLRYFLRGNIMEEIAVKAITFRRETAKMQVEAEYRKGIGYIDVFDGLPHEIKSAGAYTLKKVIESGKPLLHHCIQATYYALSTECRQAWIHYINPDTLQLHSYRIEAKDYKLDVDVRMDSIITAFKHGKLPDYIPLDPYHKSIKYSDYALFFNKKGEEAEILLKRYYPEKYDLLQSKEIYRKIKA